MLGGVGVLLLLGVGGPIEIVVVVVHGVVEPEAWGLALLEVPGDQAVAGALEAGLDEAGPGDDVAVLVALDVVGRVLEDVQQLAALEAEAHGPLGTGAAAAAAAALVVAILVAVAVAVAPSVFVCIY